MEGFVARLSVILVLVLICTVGGWLGKLWMIFEWMSHFRAQYFWIGVVGVVVMLGLRSWRWAAVPAAVMILNAPGVLCWYFGKPAIPTDNGTRIRFFLSNVHYSRVDHQRLIKMIQKERADVVVLEEVQASLVTAMEPLAKEYPHRFILPRDDAFGIAVYSKVPVDDLKDVYYGESEVPTITGTLKPKSGNVLLFATHPLPPGKPDYFAGRNEHLKLMAEDLAKRKGRIVVIGDLNVTPCKHPGSTLNNLQANRSRCRYRYVMRVDPAHQRA